MDSFNIPNDARNDVKLRTLSDSQHRVWLSLPSLASEQPTPGLIQHVDYYLLALEVAKGDGELLKDTLTQLSRLGIIGIDDDEDDGIAIYFISFDKLHQIRVPSEHAAETINSRAITTDGPFPLESIFGSIMRLAATKRDPHLFTVWSVLRIYSDFFGQCSMSQLELASLTGISERRVRTAVADLVRFGVMTATRSSRYTVYQLHPPEVLAGLDFSTAEQQSSKGQV